MKVSLPQNQDAGAIRQWDADFGVWTATRMAGLGECTFRGAVDLQGADNACGFPLIPGSIRRFSPGVRPGFLPPTDPFEDGLTRSRMRSTK